MKNLSNRFKAIALIMVISLSLIGSIHFNYYWSNMKNPGKSVRTLTTETDEIYDETALKSANLDYTIVRITNNDIDENDPKIYGGLVVWDLDPGPFIPIPRDDSEIFFYNSFTGITTQITDNNLQDFFPQINDGLITWTVYDGHDYEILLYDSSTDTSIQITNDAIMDYDAKIDGGLVVWKKELQYPKTDLFLYDYSTGVTTQITDTPYEIYDYNIHEGLVTYSTSEGYGHEIYLYNYDTGETIQITDNNYDDYDPQIHNGLITWEGYTGQAGEVFLYNYNTGETIQITHNNYDDRNQKIHNGLVTWEGYDGNDLEIFLYDYDTGETIQITDNDYYDTEPQIHNGKITWYIPYGSASEIFLYDYYTNSIIQMTNNNYNDISPQIHNGQITWRGLRPNVGSIYNDYEIFLATIVGDTSPPIINIEYQDGDATDENSGKWNIIAYDDESGINEDTINILIDGEFAGDILGDYDVPNALGEHTISVEIENNEGALGSESDSVNIVDDDTSKPVINYIYTGDGTDENPGEIIVTASDESGLSIDPSGIYSVPNSLGTYNFELTAIDNDDDRVDDALTETVIISITINDDDTTPPEIIIDYIGAGFDNNPGYFEWNVYDLNSGISEINVSINYQSTEGIDDYNINLVGTETGSWNLPPYLGFYTIEISARDSDDDRTLIVDSLTTELTRDQEIVDDDVDPPELFNLLIVTDFIEINVTFDAIDESGIGSISTFINGESIEPLIQVQYENTYSLIFENQWLFEFGTSEVIIQVEDGDDDRPDDTLTSLITGTFENALYQMYEYFDWQIEELKKYIEENLYHCITHSLNRKLTHAQECLHKAFNLFESGEITCGLYYCHLAKTYIQFTEHKTEIFNRIGKINDIHAEHIIEVCHEIRNNIVLLKGASVGTEKAYNIALLEIELLNLNDFIEGEIQYCVRRYLSHMISCSAGLLELALFKISKGCDIEWILEYTQYKLERTISKIYCFLERGRISENVANYLIEKLSNIIEDIELIG